MRSATKGPSVAFGGRTGRPPVSLLRFEWVSKVSTPSSTSGNLFHAVRRRRESAMQLIVARYSRLAKLIIRRHLGVVLRTRVQSDDILNEFWLTVLRGIDRLPSFQGSWQFRAYLRKIAVREVVKQARYHSAGCRNPELTAVSFDENLAGGVLPSGSHASESGLRERLLACAAPRARLILVRKLSGATNRQIANELDVDEGTVRRELRALRRLALALTRDSSLPRATQEQT